jgi:hypothetical protein
MQILRIKKRDQANKEVTVAVKILRSWQDGAGHQLYLHADGVYGYKDGAPVRTKAELDVIGSGVQREMARQWWEATGKELSKSFYRRIEDAERARAADFVIDDRAEQTNRDQVLYRRRPKGAAGKKEWSQPFAWMEMFTARPDWWGQAESIIMRGYEYEQADLAASEVTGAKIEANEV